MLFQVGGLSIYLFICYLFIYLFTLCLMLSSLGRLSILSRAFQIRHGYSGKATTILSMLFQVGHLFIYLYIYLFIYLFIHSFTYLYRIHNTNIYVYDTSYTELWIFYANLCQPNKHWNKLQQKMALLVTVIFDPDNLLESFVMSLSCFSHLRRSRLFPVRYSYSSLSLNYGLS